MVGLFGDVTSYVQWVGCLGLFLNGLSHRDWLYCLFKVSRLVTLRSQYQHRLRKRRLCIVYGIENGYDINGWRLVTIDGHVFCDKYQENFVL